MKRGTFERGDFNASNYFQTLTLFFKKNNDGCPSQNMVKHDPFQDIIVKNEVVEKNFTSSHLFGKKKKRKEKRETREIFLQHLQNDDISPILVNTHRETSINIIRKHSFLNFLAIAKRIRHIRFFSKFFLAYLLFLFFFFFNSYALLLTVQQQIFFFFNTSCEYFE